MRWEFPEMLLAEVANILSGFDAITFDAITSLVHRYLGGFSLVVE